MNRQQIRNLVLIISLLLFPVTMNYLSPYLIIVSASMGIVNGSLLVFIGLFVSSLLVGRLWCGWMCPASGLNNVCTLVKPEPAKGGRRNYLKYITWVLWIGIIGYLAVTAGGYQSVNPLFMTETGISVTEPQNYVIYYGIIGLIVGLNLMFGRGAMCHYLCWMAPFMVIGNRVKNIIGYPSLRLVADNTKCIQCGACSRSCPMGLPVREMVQSDKMRNSECIHCATCIDVCPRDAIKFSWKK